NGVLFLDASYGFAWSSMGAAFRTADGGASWSSVLRLFISSMDYSNVTSVSFADSTTGYAVGLGHIHHDGYRYLFFSTVDGGDTWVGGIATAYLDKVYAVGNSVFGLGDTTIRRSTDRGQTWTLQFEGVGLFGLAFVDENTGTVVGESGIILSTTDGG